MTPIRIMCHGRPTLEIAQQYGWLPGARYTNLRDLRGFERIGLIDIDWKNYDFQKHLAAVRSVRPLITVAQDVVDLDNLPQILDEAAELQEWVKKVVLVPKDIRLAEHLTEAIPEQFILGFSVPTKYGSTEIPVRAFDRRPVHLLGGRPDVQFKLAKELNVYSLDTNRVTLDASFGDYFVGDRFVPHASGGYYECIAASLTNIEQLWKFG